jgi:hypothetical protein
MALDKVAEWSGIVIEYSSRYLNQEKVVSIDEGETTLGTVLDHILTGQKVALEEKNNKIILIPTAAPLEQGTLLEHFAIYGFVQEQGRLEPLPFAVIRELPAGPVCQSNLFGYYSLSLPEGRHTIQVSYTGFPSRTIELDIKEATRMNMALQPVPLPEIKVDAGNILQRDGGSRVDRYQAEAYNNILGESDPVRSLYLLPGNIESQETTGKLIVRGGDPDQSLFLLDGNTVFNPSHLLGEISIVNSTTVKSIREFKDDFPSRFGGELSSFTEVNTKDGNMEKWSGQANAGFLAGAFTIEGPLVKGRTSMMASFRHNWTNPILNTLDSNYNIKFYDIHFKITHLLDARDKLMLSGYLGKDRLNLKQDDYQNLQEWGNRLGTVNWNHVLGSKSFVNTTFNVSNYRNLAGMQFSLYDDSTDTLITSKAFSNYASIDQYEAKTQFELSPTPYLQFHFGGKYSSTIIRPFKTDLSQELQEEIDYYQPGNPLPFREIALNYENEIKIGQDWLIRPGMYLTRYSFKDYHYNSFQPRFFSSYRINRDQQVFFSYSQMAQFLHQVTSPFLGINGDFWVPSTSLLRPSESTMYNLGYNLKNNKGTNFSAEVYYKKMKNVTNYGEQGNIFYDEDTWEQDILSGKGWSYGAEILAGKKIKSWQFQLSYALSWSWRQFEYLNDGQKYPFRYDRRHNLNVSVNYRPTKNWDFNLVWFFNTGDNFLLQSDSTNDRSVRGPSCNRFNFNTNYFFNQGKHVSHKISAGFYNAYQANNKYQSDIYNADNSDFNTTVFRNRLFNTTYYLSYTFTF